MGFFYSTWNKDQGTVGPPAPATSKTRSLPASHNSPSSSLKRTHHHHHSKGPKRNNIGNMFHRRQMSPLALLFFAGCISSIQSFSPTATGIGSGTRQTTAAATATTSQLHHGPRISIPMPFIAGKFSQKHVGSIALSMAATTSSSPSPSSGVEYPPASDGEALQSLFSKHCNGEGLMTEKELRNVPAIKDMLVRHHGLICICIRYQARIM